MASDRTLNPSGKPWRTLPAAWLCLMLLLAGCGSAPPLSPLTPMPVATPAAKAKPVIGLVLGVGAASGGALPQPPSSNISPSHATGKVRQGWPDGFKVRSDAILLPNI
jgi:hypothetical protein